MLLVLQAMRQKDKIVQTFIGRLKITMHRFPQPPSDGLRISWLRKVVQPNLVRIAEINPTLDANEYEKWLITQEAIDKMLVDSNMHWTSTRMASSYWRTHVEN